ncbi:MAG TPA: hypothetical protein VH482_31340 [Thermomicrobiales bacterium]|jgi:integrase
MQYTLRASRHRKACLLRDGTTGHEPARSLPNFSRKAPTRFPGRTPQGRAERLGHNTIGVTMDTYSHVLPDMQRKAASKLDELVAAETG